MSEKVGVEVVTTADLRGLDQVTKAVDALAARVAAIMVPTAAPTTAPGAPLAPGVTRSTAPPPAPPNAPQVPGYAPGVTPSSHIPPANPGLWPPGAWPPPPPPAPPAAPPSAPQAPLFPAPPPSSGQASSTSWAGSNGTYGPMEGRDRVSGSLWQRAMSSTAGRALSNIREGAEWAQQKASQAFTFGMGESPMGFLMSSADTYMQLSKVLTQVGQRFKDAEGNAASFGQRLGYTLGETAAYANALGEQTNTVDRVTMQRYLGFARVTGMDPGAAMGRLGLAQRLTGRALGEGDLRATVASARYSGMDQGRLDEFLSATTGILNQQLTRTGSANLQGALDLQQVPGQVFGARNPLAQGQMGADFIERLSSVVGGDTNTAMKTYMLRAMGFGTAGGPSYIEAMKRLEAGVYGEEGEQNVRDLFGSFQKQGLSREQQFKALQSASGGSLKAREIEALVNRYGSPEGLSSYGEGRGSLRSDMPVNEGWADAGSRRVSMGEGAAVEMEGMKMEVGRYTAQSTLDMRDVVVSVAKGFGSLFGENPGEMLTSVTGAAADAAKGVEDLSAIGKDIRDTLRTIVDILSDPTGSFNRATRRAVGLRDEGYAPSAAGMRNLASDLGVGGQ